MIMMVVVLLPTIVFANSVGLDMDVSYSGNEFSGHEYYFNTSIRIKEVKAGDSFEIQTPVEVMDYPEKDSNGNVLLNFSPLGDNKYKITFPNDLENVNISFGSRQELRVQSELKEFVVNGKTIIKESELPTVPSYSEDEREDSISKGGIQMPGSSNIRWTIDLNANGEGLSATSNILDRPDENHMIIEDSLRLIGRDGLEEAKLEDYIGNIVYENGGMKFDLIKDIEPNSGAITLMYYSDPIKKTDSYTNQIVIEGYSKVSSLVRFDWSDVTGEHPEPVKPIETTNINVRKIWKDHKGEELPGDEVSEITVNLLKDGEIFRTVKLNPESGWFYSFYSLDKTTEDGKVIEYSVEEVPVDGFTSSVLSVGNDFTITNTKDVPKPPVLPQVGEGLLKKEYLIGLVMVVLALAIGKRRQK